MENTLFITDLDGTLLDHDGILSDYSVKTINTLIEHGMKFSVATARSSQSAYPALQPLHLNLPVSYNNGVITYDFKEQKVLSVRPLPESGLKTLFSTLQQMPNRGFFYALEDNRVQLYHQPVTLDTDQRYLEIRQQMYQGELYETLIPLEVMQNRIPFFCVVYGDLITLAQLQENLKQAAPELESAIYNDVYNNFYFMDIFSAKASKASGAKEIAQIAQVDRLVSFGDNINDIPMLQEADESYVTENGVDSAKDVATAVIAPCSEDGVAKFLWKRLNSQLEK